MVHQPASPCRVISLDLGTSSVRAKQDAEEIIAETLEYVSAVSYFADAECITPLVWFCSAAVASRVVLECI